jgi:hypothetical protein
LLGLGFRSRVEPIPESYIVTIPHSALSV